MLSWGCCFRCNLLINPHRTDVGPPLGSANDKLAERAVQDYREHFSEISPMIVYERLSKIKVYLQGGGGSSRGIRVIAYVQNGKT
jgi:hypothetical protein